MTIWTGKDVTNEFNDVGHSAGARKLLLKYFVGVLESSTAIETVNLSTGANSSDNQQQGEGCILC